MGGLFYLFHGVVAARPPPSLSLAPPPQQDRGENKMEKLVGHDKDREITYRLLSVAKQT